MSWRNRVNNVLSRGLASFGEAVTHTPANGLPLSRRGIFNDIYQGVDAETGFSVTSQDPNLGVRLIDWQPIPKEGDTVTLRGQTYRGGRFEKDGEGGGTWFLTRDRIQLNEASRHSAFASVDGILRRSQSTFGEAVEFWPIAGGTYAQHGIFSDKYEGVDPETGFVIVSEKPNLGIILVDWPIKPIDGDVIVVYGVRYTVQYVEVDGEGGATVILENVKGISGSVPQQFNPDQFGGEFA